jgi:biotin carboxyl carrier protein
MLSIRARSSINKLFHVIPRIQKNLRFTSIRNMALNTVTMKINNESIHVGYIGEIKEEVGNVVAQDAVVMVIETEKETSHITSPVKGRLKSIYVKKDDEVKRGTKLFSVADASLREDVVH